MLRNKLLKIRMQKAADSGKKITIREMAEFLEVHPRLLAEWESNTGRQPGTDSVLKILKKLGTNNITDLFEEFPE